MIELDGLVETLAGVLGEAGIADPVVDVTGTASVGANRATVFIDISTVGDRANGPNDTTAAVAQIGSPPASAVDTAIGAAAEARLLRLAAAAGVPVPLVIAGADGVGPDAAQVLITERVEGESIPRRILRSIDGHTAGEALAEQCGQVLARLHTVSLQAVPSSIPRLDPADPYTDYCARLGVQLDELPTHHPAIRWGLNHLRRNPPAGALEPALVHGDFRNGNMLVAHGRLAALLDWELAHVGDPMEDLAWMCVRMWRFGNDDRPAGGFGSLAALRRGYQAGGGTWRYDAFRWWLTARTAWWAIGLARQVAAFRSGESTSIVHAGSGRRVPELEFDLLTLIRSEEI